MFYIFGNWKCYLKKASQGISIYKKLNNSVSDFKKVKVVVFPPFPLIPLLSRFKSKKIGVGAQNGYYETGAFTGEVCFEILKDLGCKFVIVGHSERRFIFNESDNLIFEKVKKSLKLNLTPVLCIGEKKKYSNFSFVKDFLANQLNKINSLNPKNSIIVAYEPVFSIGKGIICDINHIMKVLDFIKENFNFQKVIYGGSVDGENIKSLASLEKLDGVLVGSKSLDYKSFARIIKISNEILAKTKRK